METEDMKTLSGVLNTLKGRGIETEFVWKNSMLQANGVAYTPDKLEILKTYRFEGASDPADAVILYVIETNDGLTGFSMDSYGADSNYDEKYDNFIRLIPVFGHNKHMRFEL